MPARIVAYCDERDLRPPNSRPALIRSIIESLAAGFAAAIESAGELSGQAVNRVHLVGGGSLNALLCQATANRCGRTVLAGPVEATAIGNVLVQARAVGALTGDLRSLRALVGGASNLVRFEPRTPPARAV
jgi:rhamnulokinase